jgi:class 3 adenylate cyclase
LRAAGAGEQRVADRVGEIERMGRLRRFLPPQVADLIVASGSEKQLESHRREITALFCDLRGFTGFSESADPEDVMALLREYHAAIGDSIIKYSGTLERYAGDGVMVVFNDPVPVENPALQAVLMALEMRDAIAALTETWRRWGHDIGFGIGIAYGFATLARRQEKRWPSAFDLIKLTSEQFAPRFAQRYRAGRLQAICCQSRRSAPPPALAGEEKPRLDPVCGRARHQTRRRRRDLSQPPLSALA